MFHFLCIEPPQKNCGLAIDTNQVKVCDISSSGVQGLFTPTLTKSTCVYKTQTTRDYGEITKNQDCFRSLVVGGGFINRL